MTYLIDDLNVLFVRLCSIEVLADIVGHIHSLSEGRQAHPGCNKIRRSTGFPLEWSPLAGDRPIGVGRILF